MSISKRGRDDTDFLDIDKRPLFIQPEHSNPVTKPQSFTPVCLVRRSQFPLAYLDTTFPGNRLFHAHVNVLEACQEVGEGRRVLIVQDDSEDRLCAIERVHLRRYVLCRLAPHVRPHHIIQHAATNARPYEFPAKRQAAPKPEGERPWWDSISVELPEMYREENSPAIPELRMKPDGLWKTKQARTSQTDVTQASLVSRSQSPPGLHPIDDISTTTLSSASDLLAELSKQYLEALYLSRTSLAFFSKGPLSRARAAFSGDSNPDLRPTELIDFLRGILLNPATMDKKFREAILDAVNGIPSEIQNRPKKKRKWRAKRDRSGFFSDEKDYIETWWRKCDETNNVTSSAETVQTLWKKRAPGLRNREAFLQVILMLEVLALEKAVLVHDINPVGKEAQNIEHDNSQTEASEKRSRKKKVPTDAGDMLNNILDRLTIWHSLDIVSPSKQTNQTAPGMDDVNDDLKDFCVEVILPFYMSRIPEYAALVNRKLGGPDLLTPYKRKQSSSLRKPGQPAIRQVPGRRPRKPLERVATESLDRPSRIPSLTRSATDTDALIKREPSDATVSMRNIPNAKPKSVRVSAVQSISFNKREVDLSALHHANEEKRRKKAEIQEKLIEAIGAIKKPQRTMKGVAQQTDDSFAKAISKSKAYASRKTLGKTSEASTTLSHIKATPSHRRVQRLPSRVEDHVDFSVVPASVTKSPSNMLAIPQTGHRCRIGSPRVLLESPTMTRTGPVTVMQTPTRPLRLTSLNSPTLPGSESEQILNFSSKGPTSIYDMWNDEEYEELA